MSGGNRFRTYAPTQYEGLVNLLVDRNVEVNAREATSSPWRRCCIPGRRFS